jgi:hypothetical protein
MLTELDIRRNGDAIVELESRIALLEDAFNRLFEDHGDLRKRVDALEEELYAVVRKL